MVRIWNRVLSTSEVQADYAAGGAIMGLLAGTPASAGALKHLATSETLVAPPTAMATTMATVAPAQAGTPVQPSADAPGTSGITVSITPCAVGVWRLVATDPEMGETYLVFGENFTITGFGTRPSCPDALAVMGTWRYDDSGRIVGEYVEECAGVRIVVSFQATVECDQELRLLGTAKTDAGTYRFEAEPAAVSP